MPGGIPFVYKVSYNILLGLCTNCVDIVSYQYVQYSFLTSVFSHSAFLKHFQFDSDMKPLPPPEGKISQAHTSGIFLEKPGLLKEALERQEVYNSIVPGSFVGQNIEKADRTSTLEKALLK